VGTFGAKDVIVTPDSPEWNSGGLLASDMTISWSQQIMRVYELGANSCYYIAGRATGNWQSSQIVAPSAISFRFYQTFTAPHAAVPPVACEAADRRVNYTVGPVEKWVMTGVAVNGLGLNVVQDPLAVQQHVVGLFDNLKPNDGR
jgi:hypothetical protein